MSGCQEEGRSTSCGEDATSTIDNGDIATQDCTSPLQGLGCAHKSLAGFQVALQSQEIATGTGKLVSEQPWRAWHPTPDCLAGLALWEPQQRLSVAQ